MAAPHLLAAKKRSQMLQQDDISPEQVQELVGSRAAYYEGMLIGIIEGFVSDYNEDCKAGLVNMVKSGFSVLDTYQFYLPTNFAKFQLANIGLTEATNIVYAHCSVTKILEQTADFVDFEDPMEYIVIISRFIGAAINSVPELTGCMSEASAKEDGYMYGNCASNLVTTLLDAEL